MAYFRRKIKGLVKDFCYYQLNVDITGILMINSLIKKAKKWERDYKELDTDVKRLSSILNYAKYHCNYYSDLLSEDVITEDNAVEVLKKLPTLTKNTIRENSLRIFSDEIGDRNDVVWLNTGGSTGEPFKFPYFSLDEEPNRMIHHTMFFRQMGYRLGNKISTIGGIQIPEEDRLRNKYWCDDAGYESGKFIYSTLYMNESTLPYYVESLNHSRPNIIRGYVSGFTTLAKYIRDNKLQISFKLKGIYTTSENCSVEDKELIESVFDCPVWVQYGQTERTVFAICYPKTESYYCSPLFGFTEILDHDGNHVKKGEIGEIVVTGYTNYAMPFLRYRTGDLAVYGGTKKGAVILSNIMGRSTDFVVDEKGNKVYLVGLIFGSHLKAFNHIIQWQIEQTEKGRVNVSIVKGQGYCAEIERELANHLTAHLIKPYFSYVSNIPLTAGGKQKFLIQHLQ